jgi:hypothetical protein
MRESRVDVANRFFQVLITLHGILALRQQVPVLKRKRRSPWFNHLDRTFRLPWDTIGGARSSIAIAAGLPASEIRSKADSLRSNRLASSAVAGCESLRAGHRSH